MRRLELKLYESVRGPDGRDHIISTVHTSASAMDYAVSSQFGRYFLELVRQMDKNLDVAILEYKEKNKL